MSRRPKFVYDPNAIAKEITEIPFDNLNYRQLSLVATADVTTLASLIGYSIERDPPNKELLRVAGVLCISHMDQRGGMVSSPELTMLAEMALPSIKTGAGES